MGTREYQEPGTPDLSRSEPRPGGPELRRETERYRRYFNSTPVGLVRETTAGEILEANRPLALLLGYEDGFELVGRGAGELFADPEDAERIRARLLREGEMRPRDVRLCRADGETLWVEERAVLLPVPDSGRPEILRTFIDVDARRERERGLEKLAYQDELTGLANRRLLEIRAEQTLALANRRGTRAGVVFVDIVDFKVVNDRFGHAAGDQLLIHVARRLEHALRSADTVARIGGDEFAVLLSEVEGLDAAVRAATRLLGHVATPATVGKRSVIVEARAGVSVYPDDGKDFPSLLGRADRALIEAKAGGDAVIPAG